MKIFLICIILSSCILNNHNHSMINDEISNSVDTNFNDIRLKLEKEIKNNKIDKSIFNYLKFENNSKKIFETRDDFGMTIFEFALIWGTDEVINTFLKYIPKQISQQTRKRIVIKAAELNRINIVELLRKNGFEINFPYRSYNNYSIMHIAFRKGLADLLEYGMYRTNLSIYYNNDKNSSPIRFYYHLPHIDKIESILNIIDNYLVTCKPEYVFSKTVTKYLLNEINENLINIVLEYYDDSQKGLPPNLLLEIGNLGKNVRDYDNFELIEYLNLLLKNRMLDESKFSDDLGYNTTSGTTLLHQTCIDYDRLIYAKLLIDSNADFNLVNSEMGNTPLHYSTQNKYYEIMKELLKNGADLTIRNIHCETPLDIAVELNDKIGFNILVNGGAKYDILNDRHKELLDDKILKQHNNISENQSIKICCAYCGQNNVAKRCSACKISYYCDKECQKNHWLASHKKNCKKSISKQLK